MFLDKLNSPFGVALVGQELYVAHTDAIVRYPYVSVGRDAPASAPLMANAGAHGDELVQLIHPDDRAGALRALDGFTPHLGEAGLGSISEVFDAEAPYTPRGCIAQAWSVAEVLRGLIETHA